MILQRVKSTNGKVSLGKLWEIEHVRFCLFVLLLYVQVNSHGHAGMVSSPNHTFFLGKLEQAVNQYFMHIFSPVTDNNPS